MVDSVGRFIVREVALKLRFSLWSLPFFLPLLGCLEDSKDAPVVSDDTGESVDTQDPDDTGDPPQVNRAPGAPVISLGPTDATTLDDLVVAIVSDATDPDGDEVTYTYKWLVDGLLVEESGATLSAENTTKQETWQVMVQASDGELEGELSEASVTILNTPPTVTVILENESPSTLDDLVAIATTEDVDEDTLELTWSWTVDGAATTEDEDTVAFGETAKGEEWEVYLSVSDGEIEVEAESLEVEILNTVPMIAGITLSPQDPTEVSLVSATATPVDNDGDALTLDWEWTVNGSVVAGVTSDTMDGNSFNKHDVVVATVTPSDDEAVGVGLTSSGLTILNTEPSLTGASLAPTDLFEASTVTCVAEGWADVDSDPETIHYAWAVNGTPLVHTGSTLDGGSFSKYDNIVCTTTPDDGDTTGAAVSSASVTVQNTAPSIGTATLSTTTPVEGDTLFVSFTGVTDDDGDTVSYQYAWHVNGVPVAYTTELSSASFSKGQSVYVEVTPFDGVDSGLPVTSDTATVQNTLPVLSSVTLSPDPVALTGTLTCSPGAVSDADSDYITFAHTWTVDSNPVAATSDTLDGSYFLAGSTVSCMATPHDGEGAGATVSSNSVVANHPPSVANVSITPSAPTAADAITCLHDIPSDADFDAVSVSYAWKVNGVNSASTSNSLGTSVQRGDVVECTVTPSDPYEQGTGASASTTIQNTAPEVSSVTLSPSDPDTDATVVANAVASDLDGDTINLSFAFYVGTTLKQSSTSNQLEGSAHFQRDDVVSVHVTPSDAQDQGSAFVSSSVTVVNSLPTAPGVSISPSSPDLGLDPLTCTLDTPSTDPDTAEMGDTFTYSFSWIADSVPWTGSQTDSATSSEISTGDAETATDWICEATPMDSVGGSGPAGQASVTVSAPDCISMEFLGAQRLQADNVSGMPSGNGPRTLSAWIYSYGPHQGNVINLGSPNGTNARFSLLVNGSSLRVIGQGNDHFNVPFFDNTWTHVAVTHDGSTLRIYVDGVEMESNSGFSSNLDSSQPLLVGARDNGSSERFNGLIDNMTVWNVARSAAQIQSEMDGESLTGETGLVAWYTFAEGSGGAATDYSGSNNDGTIHGASYSMSSVCDG